MPIEAEFWKSNNRKPKNKAEDEAECKIGTYNESLTHLVPHFILGLIDVVQRLQKLCIYRNMPLETKVATDIWSACTITTRAVARKKL